MAAAFDAIGAMPTGRLLTLALLRRGEAGFVGVFIPHRGGSGARGVRFQAHRAVFSSHAETAPSFCAGSPLILRLPSARAAAYRQKMHDVARRRR
jgi:hypothetical protein